MTTYTVYYKKKFIWRKLKNVKGDGIMVETSQNRFFILENEIRIELPITYEFKFSKERYYLMKDRMENESGQNVRINKK